MARSRFNAIPLQAGLVVLDHGPMALRLSRRLEQSVRAAWAAQKRCRGEALFNGQIFTLIGAEASEQLVRNRLIGTFVEYRFLVAEQHDPGLYDQLRVRPLAVTGVIQTPDGLIFGKRADNVTQHPGCWELMPSGGVSPDARLPAGQIDVERQVLQELREELNISPQLVSRVIPRMLLADECTHVHDIVLELRLALKASQILTAFERRKTPEYTDARCVRAEDLAEFLKGARVAPSTCSMLENLRPRE